MKKLIVGVVIASGAAIGARQVIKHGHNICGQCCPDAGCCGHDASEAPKQEAVDAVLE